MNSIRFKKIYVNIILIEAVISLLCFFYISILGGESLPGQYEQLVDYGGGNYNIVYLTPYYTLGWLSTHGYFHRNAGCFWEPGAHQIFLNIAVLFILNGCLNNMNKRKRYIVVAVLILAIITTQSTAGYICLMINVLIWWAKLDTSERNLHNKIVLVFLMIICFGATIICSGIFDKILYATGSFGTRMNDTIGGMQVAFTSFFRGRGLFANLKSVYGKVGISAMSNGVVGGLVRLGFVLWCIYFWLLYKNIKTFMHESNLNTLLIFFLFVMFMWNESIMTYPLIMSFLIPWKNGKKGLFLFQDNCERQASNRLQ